MSLAIDYCREIANELKQTAIYIPGVSVKPGAIIQFDHSNLFGVPKPLGSFKVYGNLSDLGVNLETETEEQTAKDSYVYASKGSVSVNFDADVQAGSIGSGKLQVNFTKEGSTYFSAVDCVEARFKSIIGLEGKLAPHQNALNWKDFFIVIGVTTASRALIMQSSTSSAILEISGQVENLIPSGTAAKEIDAGLDLKIQKVKEASFTNNWSENVPVFFTLVRYKRKFDQRRSFSDLRHSQLSIDLHKDIDLENPYFIEVVNPSNLP
jgi:hypothetical protein